MTPLKLVHGEGDFAAGERKIAVVVGVVGRNRGRILLEVREKTALAITEGMNEGPLDEEMELYWFLAEFANMFSGKAITSINNQFKGSDLRLTPPAIFAGEDLELTTPNVQSQSTVYVGDGLARVNIGFEGD